MPISLNGEMYRKIYSNYETLRVVAQNVPTNNVYITPGGFWIHSQNDINYIDYPGGNSENINLGDGNEKWILISIDEDSHINIYEDTKKLPFLPRFEIPLAGIYITGSETIISNDMIFDVRPILELETEDDTSLQKHAIMHNSNLVGNRKSINFISGPGIFIDVIDNDITNSADVFITSGSANNATHPAETIVEETEFDLPSKIGTSMVFARADHQHGTPLNPIPPHEEEFNHLLLHQPLYDPTADEKAALAGTAGIPSSINLYVTDEDERLNNFIIKIPSTDIPAFRMITTDLQYADCNNDQADTVLGITLNTTTVKLFGKVTNSLWNWDITKPIFLGTNGLLVQDISGVEKFLQRIAIPLTPTTIFLDLFDPVDIIFETMDPPYIVTILPNYYTTTNTVVSISFDKMITNYEVIPNLEFT